MTPPPLFLAPSKTSRFSLVSTIVCWILILSFVGLMFFSQAKLAARDAMKEKTTDAHNLQMDLSGRVAVAEKSILNADGSPGAQARREQTQNKTVENLLKSAQTPLDRLKVAVLVRELDGTDAALERLKLDRPQYAGDASAKADAALLHRIYQSGPDVISDEDRRLLSAHLGWFGQLAVTQGAPDDNADRAAVLQNAKSAFRNLIAMVLLGIIGFLIGIVLLILFGVFFSQGRLHFSFRRLPADSPPVFLETFALWGIGCLLLSLALRPLKGKESTLLFEFLFLLTTGLVALWPLLRGWTWAQLRQSLGWHGGRGIAREIGAGALGYIAGLPILVLGAILTFVLSKIGHANPTHPISQEFTENMSVGKILGLFLTLSIFAPLLEETVFRGALYFHLRRRFGVAISALIVSVLFAAIHPQGWAGIPVLASIAIVLALLREWRGSLLASITAHGINNGMVLLLVVTVLK